ncbi:prepilin peptidase [Methylobacterium marchantiae]|uniref:Prepilin peptidase n=1 Tax=Methylobacterium marchantiae TaxID=600331 RepID=A0ABW3X0R7_9HYPH|nr:hypothetical protein AIGOOFII_3583 [Methylobacterium marchantiae]
MVAHIPALLTVLLALPLTVPIALIDLRRHIIPNALNGALFGLGLCVLAVQAPGGAIPVAIGLALAESALAYLLFAGLRAAYGRLRGRTGLGFGDVKLIAAAMPWIGLAQLPLMILVASLSALGALGAMRLAGHPVGMRTRLPFGPFLALGLHGAQLLRPDL